MGGGQSQGEREVTVEKPKAILIKDKQGEETVTFAGLVKRTTQQNIQRGSLLEPIAPEIQTQRSDRNAAHNYQTVLKNRLITLFCAANDLAPLNKYEYDLLCGILSREARYQTFISLDILDWGSKLKACDAVCVSIRVWHVAESEATKKVPAVIRYVGPVDGLPGITFGVEITDPHYFGQGFTDGVFQDKQYFTCPEDNGLFVSFDKLSEDPSGPQIKPAAATVAAAAAATPIPIESQHYPPQSALQKKRQRKQKVPSEVDAESVPPPLFKEEDRVVFFRKDGTHVKEKEEEELEVVRQTVLDESLNPSERHFLLHHILEEREMRKERRKEERKDVEGREMEMREEDQNRRQKDERRQQEQWMREEERRKKQRERREEERRKKQQERRKERMEVEGGHGQLVQPVPTQDPYQGYLPASLSPLPPDPPQSQPPLHPIKQIPYDGQPDAQTVSPGVLNWGSKLASGDLVRVSIPLRHAAESGATKKVSAVIRYVGPVESLAGITFGVEITDPYHLGQGSTNGIFQIKQYFICPEDNALFVSLDRLSEHPAGPQIEPAATTTSPPLIGGQCYQQGKKWFGFNVAGIEMDKVFSTEMESILSSKSRTFKVGKNKGQVDLCEEEVKLETNLIRQDTLPKIPPERPLKRLAQSGRSKKPKTPAPDPTTGDLDTSNPTTIARQLVMMKTEPMQERSEVLNKAAQKENEEEEDLEVVRQTVLDENLNPAEQHFLLDRILEEREMREERREERKEVEGRETGRETETKEEDQKRRQEEERWQQEQYSKKEDRRKGQQEWTEERMEVEGRDGPFILLVPAQHMAYAGQPGATPPPDLGLGSYVQLAQDPNRTGVVRWIGELPGVPGIKAGVELDRPMDDCGDGEWNRQRYFFCLPGRAFFCPVLNLKLDQRLVSYHMSSGVGHSGSPMEPESPEWEEQDQTITYNQIEKYIGEKRGIEGHQNSCYLDATIFGLFALSDVLDSLFLDSSVQSTLMEVQREISHILWKGIVNPLRKNGVVRYESVMRLCMKLNELGKMEGVTTAEKDPTVFLNMLFKHTLQAEPFIRIKRPFGTETKFFVQLFVEFDKSLKNPTVENLLQKMFREMKMSFTSAPSKLLVQVPRYGKQFKTYKRIIPGITLDPGSLMESPNRCFFCGNLAPNSCVDCVESFKVQCHTLHFCDDCNEKAHMHKNRMKHKTERCTEACVEMQLLSVICFENRHYVCFTRDSEGRWVFSDSMANRLYYTCNIPCGTDCTAELREWVYDGSTDRLMTAGPRELPELVRRFTEDVYMCVYIQPDFGMYDIDIGLYRVNFHEDEQGLLEAQPVAHVLKQQNRRQLVKELYRQNQKFRKMNHEFRRKKIELHRENQKFHKKKEALQMEKEELHTQKEDIQRENQKFRSKNKELHRENQKFRREKEELHKEKEELHGEKQEFSRENEELQRENQELEHRYKEVIEQLQSSSLQRIHKLEQDVLERARDVNEKQQEVEEKEQEVGYLQQELQQEKKMSARLQEQLDQSTADLEHLQQELQQEQERSALLQERLDQSIADLEHLQQGLQQEQERSAQLQERLNQSTADLEHLQQELQQEQERSNRLQEQLAQSTVDLQWEQERSARRQEQLDRSTAELEKMRPTKALLNSIQFNTASRSEVQVQESIGEGAWGVVARGQFNGQAVAIKWPHVALLEQYPNTVGRMRREVQIMSQVRHPNLVRFIAAVLDEAAEQLRASPMIISELLDTNLRIAYQEGRLQGAHCIPILRDVAFALHYLHDHLPPIIHRDVSTPNVLLQALPNGGWLAKVSDFGSANLAKLAHTAGEGALVFSAPEAFPHTDLDTEPPEMTTKMDVFSYGVLMCEVLTREPPFAHNYLRNTLQRLRRRPEHGLILRCIQRSPGDRPSMAGVLDELYKLPHLLPAPN